MPYNVDVVSLQDLCLLTVESHLSPSNVWSIFRLVPSVHCKRLEYVVNLYIYDHFMDVSRTKQFLALDEKDIQWVVENEKIIASEAAVLDGLARWYKHSKRQRENAFRRLFDNFYLDAMGRDVLSKIITKYRLFKVIPILSKYRTLLARFESLEELIYKENISNIAVCGEKVPIRTSASACHWIPFGSGFIELNPSVLEKLKERVCYPTTISYRDEFFIFGAVHEKVNERSQITLANIRIDFNFKHFSICSSLPSYHYMPLGNLVVNCGIYIYFLEEKHGSKLTSLNPNNLIESKFYRYDTVKDEWKQMASMMNCHHPKMYSGVCAFSDNQNYLYVFGTYSKKYDMRTNTWSSISTPWHVGDLSIATQYVDRMSGGISNNVICLYVIFTDAEGKLKCRLFVYNPKSDIWKSFETKRYNQCLFLSKFGQTFVLFQECIRREVIISILDPHSFKETKLASKEEFCDMDFSHMVAISRGTRMRIRQNKHGRQRSKK